MIPPELQNVFDDNQMSRCDFVVDFPRYDYIFGVLPSKVHSILDALSNKHFNKPVIYCSCVPELFIDIKTYGFAPRIYATCDVDRKELPDDRHIVSVFVPPSCVNDLLLLKLGDRIV